jgi:putative hydrolase of HD superfamily
VIAQVSGGVPRYAAGARARLRGWRADDLAAYRAWLRPEHERHRWDGPYHPVPDDAVVQGVLRRERAAGR